jgi:hypothetical protein
MGWKAMNLNMFCCHVDIGWKNGYEQKNEPPSGQKLNAADWNKEPHAAEQLADAAHLNAKQWKRNPRRHDGEEEPGIDEVNRAREEKQKSQQQADEKSKAQAQILSAFRQEESSKPGRACERPPLALR